MSYKRILLPTDGSPLSNAAALAGVDFAKDSQAETIGVYVAPEYRFLLSGEPMTIAANYITEDEYKASARIAGEGYLKEIGDAASAAGLKFSGHIEFSDSPAKRIVDMAEQDDCDLIFMGSHGRGALGQLLLGSVTAKVLSTCQIPVLVYRAKKSRS